jgi:hypothetical protein
MYIPSKFNCQLSFNWGLCNPVPDNIILDSCLYKWKRHGLWEWGFWWRSEHLASNFTPTVFWRSSDETEIQFYVFELLLLYEQELAMEI